MLKKWLDENMTMSDVLIIVIVLAGLVAALLGLKEFFGASIGAATTYITKDRSKRTQEQEERTKVIEHTIKEERSVNDEAIQKRIDKALAVVQHSDLDDLVDAANARLRGSTEK